METFSAGSCVSFGRQTFEKRPWFFIGSSVLFTLVVGVIAGTLQFAGQGSELALILATIVRYIVEIISGICSTNFFLKAHDDPEHVHLKDFLNFKPFWNYIAASLLFVLIFVGGLILLIVPGIIWGIMFGQAPYIVIDQKRGPIDALKESRRLTNGHKWELFLLGIFSFLIVLLGLICFIIGIFVAIPVVTLAVIHAYRTLQKLDGTSSVANA